MLCSELHTTGTHQERTCSHCKAVGGKSKIFSTFFLRIFRVCARSRRQAHAKGMQAANPEDLNSNFCAESDFTYIIRKPWVKAFLFVFSLYKGDSVWKFNSFSPKFTTRSLLTYSLLLCPRILFIPLKLRVVHLPSAATTNNSNSSTRRKLGSDRNLTVLMRKENFHFFHLSLALGCFLLFSPGSFCSQMLWIKIGSCGNPSEAQEWQFIFCFNMKMKEFRFEFSPLRPTFSHCATSVSSSLWHPSPLFVLLSWKWIF